MFLPFVASVAMSLPVSAALPGWLLLLGEGCLHDTGKSAGMNSWGDSRAKSSGVLVGNFCFDPLEVLKRACFKLFSTPKRYQKQQHTESDEHPRPFHMGVPTHIRAHFVPVSCKQIQSHKWELGGARTGLKVTPVSCQHPLSIASLRSRFHISRWHNSRSNNSKKLPKWGVNMFWSVQLLELYIR